MKFWYVCTKEIQFASNYSLSNRDSGNYSSSLRSSGGKKNSFFHGDSCSNL